MYAAYYAANNATNDDDHDDDDQCNPPFLAIPPHLGDSKLGTALRPPFLVEAGYGGGYVAMCKWLLVGSLAI